MATRISVARAKAHLSELMAKVAYGDERYIIEKRGRAVVALINLADLERLEAAGDTGRKGALGLVGAWEDVAEEEMEALLEDVYAERSRDTGRRISLDC